MNEKFNEFAQSAGLIEVEAIERAVANVGSTFIVDKNKEPSALNPMFAPGLFRELNHVLHDALLRQFYEYDPQTGLWVQQTDDTMRRKLADLIFQVGIQFGKPNIAAKERTDQKLRGALNNLRSLADSRFDDRPVGFIHCSNGMLEIKTGKLHPFGPEYKSRNATPIPWSPDAECPRFFSELLGTALNAQDIKIIQLYAGMALMGRNLAQRILLFTGTAGGGKSQLVIVLEGLIGRTNSTEVRTEHLCDRFEIARLVGKTLLTGKDVPGGFLMTKGASKLKALSGGDSLNTEVKGKMGSDCIDGEFCIVVTSNSRLRVKLDGDTGAWRRRLLIVRYDRPKPTKAIPDFARLLLAEEGSGILRWAVEGARELIEREFEFPISEEQQRRVDDLLDESNALRSFVGNRIYRREGSNLATHQIVEAFFAFCEERGWTAGSAGTIERELGDVMMEIHRVAKSNSIEQAGGKSAKGYRGVAFAEAVDGEEPAATDWEDTFDHY